MDDKTDPDAGTPPVGLPEPNPPEDDPDAPQPADLVPGLGGTSKTKPEPTEDA